MDPHSYVASLLRKLLAGHRQYFDKRGYLNSEGMKLVNEIARVVAQHFPHIKPLVDRLRRDGSLQALTKLAERFLSSDEVSELIETAVYGVYRYTLSSEPDYGL